MPIKKTEEKAETKHCPYCDNEIKAKAIKCQYCGEFLDKEGNQRDKNRKTRIENDKIEKDKTISKGAMGLLRFLGIVIIILGIITFLSPSIFWTFMDIIIGALLVIIGVSWLINIPKNKGKFLGIGYLILGLLFIFSSAEFVGTLSIWAIAIWALIRGFILIFYSFSRKDENKFWPGILILGILLIILFFIIAFSDKDEARAFVGICIGISTILDGLALIIWPNKVNKQIKKQNNH